MSISRGFGIKALMGASLVASLSGCADAPVGTRIPSSNDHQRVAQSIALALNDSSLRVGVLQAMRASPYVEHKLVLQDFVMTPVGETLMAAAAASVGGTVASLKAELATMPRMDVYVASKIARLGWTGGDNIAVALTLDKTAPRQAFTLRGPVDFSVLERQAGLTPIFLRPTKNYARRLDPQSGSGEVIQDANDGEVGVQVEHTLPDGSVILLDMVRNANGKISIARRSMNGLPIAFDCDETEHRDPDACGGEGGGGYLGGSGMTPTTYLDHIRTRGVCDVDWFCQSNNEFRFRAHEYDIWGIERYNHTIHVTGVPPCKVGSGLPTCIGWAWSSHVPLLWDSANGDGRLIVVEVSETDYFGDDRFRPYPVLADGSDNGRYWEVGNLVDPTLYCQAHDPDEGTSNCRELLIVFSW